MRYLAACGLFLAASALAGDVDVRGTAAGRVSVHVTAAPLSEVLDRLARQTGMKVVYDDPDGHDKLYRFMESIQEFFDLSGQIGLKAPGGGEPRPRTDVDVAFDLRLGVNGLNVHVADLPGDVWTDIC